MRLSLLSRRLYYPNQVFISNDYRRIQHQWLPRRLLLVRHGESEANVNREVYSSTPDWKIPLTPLGREQAFNCGQRLRHIIQDEKLYIYYSPYARTRQTLDEIRRSFDESQIQGEREDERLREQEMGNYQPMDEMDRTWAARNKFGRLYYRFPFGESGADVGDRVSGFFDSLLRERIGLTVPNMNERLMQGAKEELGCLGLGRWSGEGDATSGCAGDGDGERNGGGEAASASAPPCSFARPPVHESHPSSQQQQQPERGHDTGVPTSPLGTSSPSFSSRERAGHAGHHASLRTLSHLGEADIRGVLPPNDLGASAGEDQNVLIVAHGLLIRLFIGRWFRVPMEVFETMCNPPNCSIIVLERDDEIGRLVMTDISKGLLGSDPLLQMMKFDGQEDTHWYRQRFLGIVDPKRAMAEEAVAEDDDENHYSKSAAHYRSVGAPDPRMRRGVKTAAAAATTTAGPSNTKKTNKSQTGAKS